MSVSRLGVREECRGVALVMVLAATVLVGSLTLVALQGALVQSRLVSDARWRAEGAAVVATALATVRVAQRADLDTLSDGAVLSVTAVTRADGWTWSASALRSGAVIRVSASALRHAADGSIYAARRASLLLSRNPADTVRVLAQRARF
jgi:hypothetical protein